MMLVLSSAEMDAADRLTFEKVGVPVRAVIESAGREVAALLIQQFPEEIGRGAVFLCGKGNNGADGYAASRALLNRGIPVTVLALTAPAKLAGDARETADSFLKQGGRVIEITAVDAAVEEVIDHSGIIVDAIYGTGFRGKLPEPAAALIGLVNRQALRFGLPLVAVDIPSGVDGTTGEADPGAIRAQTTVVLQSPKIGHVLFPGAEFCGEQFLVDIGVAASIPAAAPVRRRLITEEVVRTTLNEWFSERADSHKGKRGHVLVIGGCEGHYGAPKLSAQAAFAAGAGLVTVGLPESVARIAAPGFVEMMAASFPDDGRGNFAQPDRAEIDRLMQGKSAVVIGPGLGQGAGSAALLRTVLISAKERNTPLIIDADGLNLVATHKLFNFLSAGMVLTPHPGEMARLIAEDTAEVQRRRVDCAASFSQARGCWLVLKGARSIIAAPDGQININPAAVESLATAGSGDVLSGFLAGFLGRGMPPAQAIPAAVFLHGVCGEVLSESYFGSTGVRAGELADVFSRLVNLVLREDPALPVQFRRILPGSLHPDRIRMLTERIGPVYHAGFQPENTPREGKSTRPRSKR